MVGIGSLIPFLGLLFAGVSVVLGIVKIEKKGGWSLLVLAAMGFCLTAGLSAVYWDQIFPAPVEVGSSTASRAATGSTAEAGSIVWLQPN